MSEEIARLANRDEYHQGAAYPEVEAAGGWPEYARKEYERGRADEYHQGEGPLDGSIEHWMARAEAAEAKLEAVRAWAEEKATVEFGLSRSRDQRILRECGREVMAIIESGGRDGE